MPKPKDKPQPKPEPKPSPAQDIPLKSLVEDDAPPKPTINPKIEADIPVKNPHGHLDIIGKHVPSGPNETRLFQVDINTKQYLTRDEAKAQGRYWKDH